MLEKLCKPKMATSGKLDWNCTAEKLRGRVAHVAVGVEELDGHHDQHGNKIQAGNNTPQG